MADIVMIPIDHLFPHKDNPRQNVGDVSELAESIKAKGVLQNLTVVPAAIPNDYIVLIGHRRLAAAKLAGLEELPCTVTDMSYEDQIATMLVENIQRSDLTVYEEAKGFQMMLDLGKTVKEVSEMSGFSQSTVQRRVKLADLDEKKFKKAVERGATLFDFAELDTLETIEEKNEVLQYLGTADWKNKLRIAVENQKHRKEMEAWSEQVSQFAKKLDSVEYIVGGQIGRIGEETIKLQYVRNWGRWTIKPDEPITPPTDAMEKAYYFRKTDSQIDLYKEYEVDAKEEAAKAAENARREAHKQLEAQFAEMDARHRELRLEFIKGINKRKVKDAAKWEMVTEALIYARKNGGGYYNSANTEEELAKVLGISYDEKTKKMDYHEFLSEKMSHPDRTALITAWLILDSGSYWTNSWISGAYHIVYRENPAMDKLYTVLSSLGYEESAEERELRRGTHKLFEKVDEIE